MPDLDVLATLPTWLTHALPLAAQIILLLLGGWVVAWVLGRLTRRLGLRLGDLLLTRTAGRRLEPGSLERLAVNTLARIVFWTVLVLFVAAASDRLGITVITDVLREVAQYVPNIAAVVLIGAFGAIAGNFVLNTVRGAATRAGLASADMLGELARSGVFVAATLLAMDQLGIESTVLLLILGIVLTTVVGGGALAFGLGARDAVAGFLAARELARTYQVGDRLRIGDLEGHVLQLTRTAVLLHTPSGTARVPAALFDAQPALLITDAP